MRQHFSFRLRGRLAVANEFREICRKINVRTQPKGEMSKQRVISGAGVNAAKGSTSVSRT